MTGSLLHKFRKRTWKQVYCSLDRRAKTYAGLIGPLLINHNHINVKKKIA